MGWSVISFLIMLFITMLFIYILIVVGREMQRLDGFDGFTKFLLVVAVSVTFICLDFPTWTDTLDLDDSKIVTGVLDYQDGNFILTGSGDDYPDWDFSCCNSVSMVKLHCKGKEIKVWHNDHVVYQVEKNGKVIYSILNNNLRIVLSNLIRIMNYIWIFCFSILAVFHIRLPSLQENEEKDKFEQRLTTEEELNSTEEVQKPAVTQSEIKNTPEITTAAIRPTSKPLPSNMRPAMSNQSFATMDEIDNDSKIVRRFCKNCGAELGKIIEISRRVGKTRHYDQYKFCANCGLDSDPNRPVENLKSDKYTIMALIATIFVFGGVPFALIIITMTGGFAFMTFALPLILFAFYWLTDEDIECPSCGKYFNRGNYCTNCGMALSKTWFQKWKEKISN